MNEFKSYHPLVNFIYFTLVIGFSCFLLHPICLIISLICGAVPIKNKRIFLWLLPMLIFTILLNPLFNHGGQTIITYFKNAISN